MCDDDNVKDSKSYGFFAGGIPVGNKGVKISVDKNNAVDKGDLSQGLWNIAGAGIQYISFDNTRPPDWYLECIEEYFPEEIEKDDRTSQ